MMTEAAISWLNLFAIAITTDWIIFFFPHASISILNICEGKLVYLQNYLHRLFFFLFLFFHPLFIHLQHSRTFGEKKEKNSSLRSWKWSYHRFIKSNACISFTFNSFPACFSDYSFDSHISIYHNYEMQSAARIVECCSGVNQIFYSIFDENLIKYLAWLVDGFGLWSLHINCTTHIHTESDSESAEIILNGKCENARGIQWEKDSFVLRIRCVSIRIFIHGNTHQIVMLLG